MKKSNVYTRTGDSGTTGLISGQRVVKSDVRIEAYGTIDELSSHIGLLSAENVPAEIAEKLEKIQNMLFCVGSELALGNSDRERLGDCKIVESDVCWVESEIDKADSEVPPMKSFILPGGCRASAQAHICRTVCRRAERRIYEMSGEFAVSPILLSFINRLSDYFFLLARQLNFLAGKDEIIWAKPCRSE